MFRLHWDENGQVSSLSLAGTHLRMLNTLTCSIRFDKAKIRRLNQAIERAADADVEFLPNLIRCIEFNTAEMRGMNRA